ncbi:MAG: ABC transporter ATP-binding protein [Acidobacteria bacterium]|nr:ABC transporter ATP-binding protein [Acidobacteriota bacterium]
MSSAVVEFENIGKLFEAGRQAVRAVEHVDLGVHDGEFVTIVGPSGCGKSTLLNMAAGLLQPTEGTVRYRGVPVTAYNHATGYMTQNDHLLPWRDVVGNIAVPLEIKRFPRASIRERVQALIDLVGLTGFERSYPAQLSGGMRKRTALARLLAYDPETFLMDEPFAALDAQLRVNMQIEVRRLCRRLNKTVLFVTHDLDEAVALGDRCVVFSPRPGTIRKIVDIPLAPTRDLLRLRHDPAYVAMTAELWDMIAPSLAATGGEPV